MTENIAGPRPTVGDLGSQKLVEVLNLFEATTGYRTRTTNFEDNQWANDFFDVVGVDLPEFSTGAWLYKPAVVPIPAAGWLFLSALLGMGWMSRKKR